MSRMGDANAGQAGGSQTNLGETASQVGQNLRDLGTQARDVASASLLEVWIDETERRTWFLFEASRRERSGGH